MKLYTQRDLAAARGHAIQGGQALFIMVNPGGWPGAPRCFERSREWGKLFDQDTGRLVCTARHLGVRKIVVHHKDTERQHVDLCGQPLIRARRACEVSV